MYLWSCILFSRLLCNVAFATCTYRLQPHRATRTSIPLRFISVVAFATCTYRLQPHGATRTSIPLRFISVVAFATCAKKRKGLLECKHSSALSSFFSTRCSMLNVKNRRPRGSQCPQKQRFLSARSGVRTLDTLIKSQVLYQLS